MPAPGEGHRPEALRAMCEEFLALSAAFGGQNQSS